MRGDQVKKWVEQAAAATRERIDLERQRVSVQLGPILRRAKARLLDPQLTAEALLGGDKNLAACFAQELGRPPWSYVTEGRLEVAERLLRDTDLQIYRIAMELGYQSAQAFGRAFKRERGQSPKDYRDAARKASTDAVTSTDGTLAEGAAEAAPAPMDLMGQVQRGLDGALDAGEVQTLLHRIQGRFRLLYPDSLPPATAARPVAGAEFAEASMAATLWQRIEHRPFDQQRDTIRTQLGFTTPALYRFLCNTALEVCLDDAGRGVEIARLIPVSIEGIADRVGDLVPTLWVQAWSILGNCLRTAGDYPGAEEAFAAAWEELQAAGPAVEPWFLMQLCLFETSLRIMQHRLPEVWALLKVVVFILENPDPVKYRREQEALLEEVEDTP